MRLTARRDQVCAREQYEGWPTARESAAGRRSERTISSLERTMSNRITSKLLAEFIGTLTFVFIGAGAAAVVGGGAGLNGIVAVAFAHGLAIMAFAFAYGSVSGGHMNPAVTVGVLAAGAMGH